MRKKVLSVLIAALTVAALCGCTSTHTSTTEVNVQTTTDEGTKDYNFKSENVSSINGKEYYAGQVTSDFAQKNNISDDYFIVDLTDAKVSYLHEIDAIGTISDGLLAVQNKNGKWGYVDLSGKIVIEFQFEEAHDFSNGKADVIYKYKKQMIDTKGNIL